MRAWLAETADGRAYRLRLGEELVHVDILIEEAGSRISAWHSGNEARDEMEATLTGLVLACPLRARGMSCLHATVVSIDGGAVALVGRPATGKSTTAMGLLEQGAGPVTEDLAAFVEEDGRFFVQPGSPQLWVRRVEAGSYIAWQRSGEAVPRGPVPLLAVYDLLPRDKRADGPVIVPLSPSRALATLLAHISADFMLSPPELRREMDVFARLARRVPVRAVQRGDGIAHVAAACRAIFEDVRTLVSSPAPIRA